MFPYFTVFGRQISMYGLCIAVALVLCYLCASRRAAKGGRSTDHLMIIGATAFLAAVLGAKALFLAVTFTPKELWQLIQDGQLKALANGGLVFYGGLICGVPGAWLGAKIAGTPLIKFERDIVPFLPFGYGIGRIGCFLGGCCYGFSCGSFRFPVQLLDTAISCGVGIFLILFSKKERKPYTLLTMYLAIYALQRFLLEFLRGDIIRGSFWLFSTSQWISLGLLAVCSLFLILRRRKNA